MKKGLIRKETVSIEEVMEKIKPSYRKVKDNIQGEMIKVSSGRLFSFKKNGTTCVSCGLDGSFFAMEKKENDKSYHLNLYGINEKGEEVLMTRDHIIPKAKGGGNEIKNLQTLCEICNLQKADTYIDFKAIQG